MVVEPDGLAVNVQLPAAVLEGRSSQAILGEHGVPVVAGRGAIELLEQAMAAVELDLHLAAGSGQRLGSLLGELGLEGGEGLLGLLAMHRAHPTNRPWRHPGGCV
jgi:hypothetical protein